MIGFPSLDIFFLGYPDKTLIKLEPNKTSFRILLVLLHLHVGIRSYELDLDILAPDLSIVYFALFYEMAKFIVLDTEYFSYRVETRQVLITGFILSIITEEQIMQTLQILGILDHLMHPVPTPIFFKTLSQYFLSILVIFTENASFQSPFWSLCTRPVTFVDQFLLTRQH